MNDPLDTIAAVASAPGGAARGIVRLSGPQVQACLAGFFQPTSPWCLITSRSLPSSQSLSRGPRAESGSARLIGIPASLPCTVYLWPSPRSYTRQPSAEVHTLGSPPLLEALLRTACAHGARPALPGEFTLRAFLAGRLDLTQAEAVLGVVDAADPRELDVALAQMAGGLAGSLHRVRDELLDLLAQIEAGLDFVEEDIEFVAATEVERCLAAASATVSELLGRMSTRDATSDAVRAVLVGSPNVGKSSLFNALVGDSAAIVSEAAGTTRDFLIGQVNLDGITCRLIDTAGIDPEMRDQAKENETAIDATAQRFAAEQHQAAHVCVLCLDASRGLNDWERAELLRGAPEQMVVALTKCDRPRGIEHLPELPAEAIATSSLTGQGIEALRRRLRETVIAAARHADADVVGATALRCHDSLRRTAVALEQARQMVQRREGEELVASEIRLALDELGQVSGAVYNDDVLDRIFSRFCIGK